jgi:C1A family cysteine protease
MTTLRHALLIALAAALLAFTAPAAAAGAAADAAPQLELGRLNPAFVEAAQDAETASDSERLPSPVEVEVGAAVEARAARKTFPAAYSLVAQGLVTNHVQDQDYYGTCWSFSNVAALESLIIKREGQALDLSEDNLVARSGFWTSAYRRYHWGGYDFMAVAYFARWAGPLLESTDPYPPASIYEGHAGRPVQRHVQDVAMIPGRGWDLDNDLIKQLVMDNGALSVGMFYDQQNESSYLNRSAAAYYYPVKGTSDDPTQENHGVAIVGWDDGYPAESFVQRPPGDGAFLVRNSWGDAWPTADAGGYFWVSYYDTGFARDLGLGTWGGCTSYATVESTRNYSRNYGHDKLGVTRTIGYRQSGKQLPIWAANRFTAASARPIVAAGFYTLSSGTPFELWAGTNLKTLKRYASGTAELPGYHTVTLSHPFEVRKGKKFVVAIKLTSPDGRPPLALERRLSCPTDEGTVVLAPATAKRGQSFVGLKRWRLVDLTSQKGMATANVCLKAFAR